MIRVFSIFFSIFFLLSGISTGEGGGDPHELHGGSPRREGWAVVRTDGGTASATTEGAPPVAEAPPEGQDDHEVLPQRPAQQVLPQPDPPEAAPVAPPARVLNIMAPPTDNRRPTALNLPATHLGGETMTDFCEEPTPLSKELSSSTMNFSAPTQDPTWKPQIPSRRRGVSLGEPSTSLNDLQGREMGGARERSQTITNLPSVEATSFIFGSGPTNSSTELRSSQSSLLSAGEVKKMKEVIQKTPSDSATSSQPMDASGRKRSSGAPPLPKIASPGPSASPDFSQATPNDGPLPSRPQPASSGVFARKYKKIAIGVSGGGGRGLIPALIAAEFKRRYGLNLLASASVIGGTSSGALTIVHSILEKDDRLTPPQAVVDTYLRDTKTIFNRPWWDFSAMGGLRDAVYPRTGFNKVLDQTIPPNPDGSEKYLSDLHRPNKRTVLITATKSNNDSLYLFSSRDAYEAREVKKKREREMEESKKQEKILENMTPEKIEKWKKEEKKKREKQAEEDQKEEEDKQAREQEKREKEQEERKTWTPDQYAQWERQERARKVRQEKEARKKKLNFSLKHVLTATTAVPFLFAPAIVHDEDKTEIEILEDGGLGANNPIQVVKKEIESHPEIYGNDDDYIYISLGTGRKEEASMASTTGYVSTGEAPDGQEAMKGRKKVRGGFTGHGSPRRVLGTLVATAGGIAYENVEESGVQSYSFDPVLDKNLLKINTKSKRKIDQIRTATLRLFEDQKEEFDAIAEAIRRIPPDELPYVKEKEECEGYQKTPL